MHAVQVFDSQVNMFNLRSFFVPYRNKPLLDSVTVESQFVSYCVVYHCICTSILYVKG